jgi:hypothetical protein
VLASCLVWNSPGTPLRDIVSGLDERGAATPREHPPPHSRSQQPSGE